MTEGVNDSLYASLDEARRWVEGGGDPAELHQVLVQCQALLDACSTSDLRQLLQLPLEQQDPPVCPPHLVIAEVVAEEVVTHEGDGSLESDGIEIESDDGIGHINHLTLDAIVSTGDELEVLDVVAMTEEPHVIAEHEGTISGGGDGTKYTYQAPPPSCTRAIPTIHPLYPLYSLLPLHLHQEYATGGAFRFLGFDEGENYAFYERRADGRQES